MTGRKKIHLGATDILRARNDVWGDETADTGMRIVLAGNPARYLRIPHSTARAMAFLLKQPLGETVGRMRSLFPNVNLDDMLRLELVDLIPLGGVDPSPKLVAELWTRNLLARTLVQRRGWSALATWMSAPDAPYSIARPLIFDEIEAAARVSFAFPATSRQCTVVALAVCAALSARRIPARIAVIAENEQAFMHSFVVVGSHIVDPSDTTLETKKLVPLWINS